jgi:pimeloyl-ACP methyl ester carboxylesterase
VAEQSFDAGPVRLNYAEWPSAGPALLFLHGLATRWQIFKALIPRLRSHWHIYALDFRGHGKSGHVPGHYTVSDFEADTTAFLEVAIKEPAVIFGHSMGGWIAAAVAAHHPELTRAIVLCDTAIYPDSVPNDEILMNLFGVSAAMLRDGRAGTNAWPQSLRELDSDVLTGYLDGKLVQGFDADELLPQISCPVLLLQGNVAHGGLMTDQDVTRAQPLLKHMRHVFFDGAGHWVHVQEGDRVLEELSQFAGVGQQC